MTTSTRTAALRFVLLIGVVSFFADFTYEGARSITGPFMAVLGASGAVVGIVAGLGELLGYGLRLVSGKLSEKTQKFYLGGAALVAAGFADFPLIAYHFEKADAIHDIWIPRMYSIAMAVSGAGSLLFGRMFDRVGLRVLIPLTLVSAIFAPLVFLGGFWPAIVGSALWGLGMGVHESIVPAAVATMVPPERRPSAYGVFTAGYGVAWFIGSAVMGALYDRSITGVVIFCVALQLAALPIFRAVGRMARPAEP